MTRRALDRGIESFNAGRYFEAHEAWEEEWLRAPAGPWRDGCQGLIQVAAALHHAARGNARGAVRLLDRAGERLRRISPSLLGVDLDALLSEVAELRELLGRDPSAGFDPARGPRIRRTGESRPRGRG
jgi:predicted metal-dependent hydrolase